MRILLVEISNVVAAQMRLLRRKLADIGCDTLIQTVPNMGYRVNSDRSRRTGGAGLGLAIARAIIQAHDGSLQVQSKLDKGSTFTIRLPLGISSSESVCSALSK